VRTLDGCGLYAEVHDGDGPYALCVHGILSSRAQWLLNLDALRSVCRPVVVELLGHGRSPAPDGAEPYTPRSYSAAFERIRVSLGTDRWFVVGQSLGAALTLRYVLDQPYRVIAHVFTNSSSALADETWQKRMALNAPAFAKRIDEGGVEAIAAMPIHPKQAKRLPPDVHEALLDDAELLSPHGVANAMLHTVPTSSVRDRVSENRVPTLLVTGGKEKEFDEPRAFAEAYMRELEIVVLPAGHAVNIQAADGFNGAVTEFFARRR
jgi:pimeloyl-ACP methyl ester carboxylesterase